MWLWVLVPDIIHMQITKTDKMTEAMRNPFMACGLPKEVVKDNGPQFKTFHNMNMVKTYPNFCLSPYLKWIG